MFDSRSLSFSLSSKELPASKTPAAEQPDFSDAIVGGGDPRIAELVAEARAQGYEVQDRSSGPLHKDNEKFRPPGYETGGE